MRWPSYLLIFVSFGASAQPMPSWVAVGTGPGSDITEAVAMDSFRDIVAVAGTFEQTLTFGALTLESADLPGTDSDAYVAAFASTDGAPLWARRMGTDQFNDFGTGVAVCAGGLVVASGHFTGSATFDGGGAPDRTLTTRNDFDGFVVAYSTDGDLVWLEQIGGSEQDLARRVVCDPTGGIYVVGSFTGTATWGEGAAAQTRTSAGSADGFVAKYDADADGVLRWVTAVGGSDFDVLTDAAVPPYQDDLLVASGTFRGVATFGAIPLQSRGQSDAVAIRLDSETGIVLAAGQVGGAGFDYGRGIALNGFRNTGVLLAGSFESDILLGSTVLQSAGQADAYFAFLDAETLAATDGDRLGGAGVDYATDAGGLFGFYGDLTDATFGAVGVMNGDASSTLLDWANGDPVTLAGRGFDDGFALSYLTTEPGYVYAAEVVGGTNADRAYAIAGDEESNAVLAGSFRDEALVGTETILGTSGNDVFTAYFDDQSGFAPVFVAGEAEPDAIGAALAVSPNPSRGDAAVTVRLDVAAVVTVEVIDALGRSVATLAQGPLAAGDTRLAVPRLAPGVYVVLVRGEATARRTLTVLR